LYKIVFVYRIIYSFQYIKKINKKRKKKNNNYNLLISRVNKYLKVITKFIFISMYE